MDIFYFSPTGGTKKAALLLSEKMGMPIIEHDLIEEKDCQYQFEQDDIVLVAAPVFAGRIPKCVTDELAAVKGSHTRAIAMVVYGNRAYEDALIELKDFLKKQDFEVIAGVVAVAQHTYSQKVANNRPDIEDEQELAEFAIKIKEKLAKYISGSEIYVPGNEKYKETSTNPYAVEKTESCISCGLCVKICPLGLISQDNQQVAEKEKCMLCKACVTRCPVQARVIPKEFDEMIRKRLSPLENIRNKNELWIGEKE